MPDSRECELTINITAFQISDPDAILKIRDNSSCPDGVCTVAVAGWAYTSGWTSTVKLDCDPGTSSGQSFAIAQCVREGFSLGPVSTAMLVYEIRPVEAPPAGSCRGETFEQGATATDLVRMTNWTPEPVSVTVQVCNNSW